MKVAASRLRDKAVVTDKGHTIGIIYDLIINEENGKILALVVEPEIGKDISKFIVDREGMILIPYGAVKSVREIVVIDERELVRRQMLAKVPRRSGIPRLSAPESESV